MKRITNLKFLAPAIFVLAILAGCGKQNDKEAIVGIWNIHRNTFQGMVVGDGKDWIEFKADGTCDTRPRPGGYESGTYILNPENHTIEVKGQNGGRVYQYVLTQDSLTMTATLETGGQMALYGVRTDKYPITADQEPLEDLSEEPIITMPMDTSSGR